MNVMGNTIPELPAVTESCLDISNDVKNIKDLHYVDEIMDKNYKRYSISGWIYETSLKTKNTISLL